MKPLVIPIAIIATLGLNGTANAISIVVPDSSCSEVACDCAVKTHKYCCPQPTNFMVCPTGWTLSGLNVCSRSATTTTESSNHRYVTTTYGTSPNRNTGGIETCYAAANTTHTDQTGTFTFTSACQYTK